MPNPLLSNATLLQCYPTPVTYIPEVAAPHPFLVRYATANLQYSIATSHLYLPMPHFFSPSGIYLEDARDFRVGESVAAVLCVKYITIYIKLPTLELRITTDDLCIFSLRFPLV
jgi:hypothetical protein